jgi:hypothetical protein
VPLFLIEASKCSSEVIVASDLAEKMGTPFQLRIPILQQHYQDISLWFDKGDPSHGLGH